MLSLPAPLLFSFLVAATDARADVSSLVRRDGPAVVVLEGEVKKPLADKTLSAAPQTMRDAFARESKGKGRCVPKVAATADGAVWVLRAVCTKGSVERQVSLSETAPGTAGVRAVVTNGKGKLARVNVAAKESRFARPNALLPSPALRGCADEAFADRAKRCSRGKTFQLGSRALQAWICPTGEGADAVLTLHEGAACGEGKPLALPSVCVYGGTVIAGVFDLDFDGRPEVQLTGSCEMEGEPGTVAQTSWLELDLATGKGGPLVVDEPPPLRWVWASRANLRARPEASAKKVATLPIGHALRVVERGGGWTKVSGGGVTGYALDTLLQDDEPTLAALLQAHDDAAKDDAQGRLRWAERAAAFDGTSIAAFERLERALVETGGKQKSLKRVRRRLRTLRK